MFNDLKGLNKLNRPVMNQQFYYVFEEHIYQQPSQTFISFCRCDVPATSVSI